MTWEAWYTAGVLALVLGALVSRRVGPDVALLGGLTLLLTAGSLVEGARLPAPSQAFAGFGNPGLLTVGVLFVIAGAMTRTGAMQWITSPLLGMPQTAAQAQARLTLPVAGLSAVMNNTPIVAMLVPVVGDWSKRINVPVSRLLLPLSYASILGGTCTLIGTSTNLVVYGLAKADGIDVGLFAVGIIGLPVTVVGLVYLAIAAPRLLPARTPPLSFSDDAKQYTVEMTVDPGGALVGKTIEKAGLRALPGLFLIELDREDEVIPAVSPETVLRGGDRLVFAGVIESVVDLRRLRGLSPAGDQVFKLNAPMLKRRMVEVVVSPACPLVGKTIREGRFRTHYQAVVIALARDGQRVNRKIGDIRLRAGDTLLLEASEGFRRRHRNSRDFFLVGAVEDATPPDHARAVPAIMILSIFVALAGLQILSPLNAALIAAGLLWLTRCITASEARGSVDWSVLLVIGAALGIAESVRISGLAETVVSQVMAVAGSNPLLALAAIYLLTNVFTELITNNAAAALIYPIAVLTAGQFDADPLPFILTVMVAASASFATPIGYQTNLMVYGPGGYRFSDYVRLGLPLNVLVFLTTLGVAYLMGVR